MACILPFLAFAGAGGHVLVGDNVYGPTRRFVDRMLPRWGCEATYFDPLIGAGVARLIRPETKLIFVESPGSMTFEIADAPAIAAAARAAGVVSVMDNTWSAGVFHKPLALGFDLSVQANTKYVSGGADILNGAIHLNDEKLLLRLRETVADLGVNVAPDDAYALLRGARSLAMRMDHHQASALEVARWLEKHPAIVRVLHPALESDPNHALWKRDFTGASGLFSIVLNPMPTAKVHVFLDALDLFGLGFSYGGFESLVIHCDPQLKRTASSPELGGPLIRLSIGLEEPADLIADLEQALAQVS
jgi:cystathionine beta-lyase